jgi:hypothetical protein
MKRKKTKSESPAKFTSGSAEVDKSMEQMSSLWKTNEDGSRTISLNDVMKHLGKAANNNNPQNEIK